MSWSRGEPLLQELVDTIDSFVGNSTVRKAIYREFIEVFEEYDCDNFSTITKKNKEFRIVEQGVYPYF